MEKKLEKNGKGDEVSADHSRVVESRIVDCALFCDGRQKQSESFLIHSRFIVALPSVGSSMTSRAITTI